MASYVVTLDFKKFCFNEDNEQNFTNVLSQISNKGVEENAFLESRVMKCVQLCKVQIEETRGDPFARCEDLYRIFKKVINCRYKLLPQKREFLEKIFKKKLVEAMKDVWAIKMADRFMPIPDIDEEAALVPAAQKWGAEFFQGIKFFCAWENQFIFSSYVEGPLEKVQEAYKERFSKPSKLRQVVVHAKDGMELVTDVFPGRLAQNLKLMRMICWAEYWTQSWGFNELGKAKMYSDLKV